MKIRFTYIFLFSLISLLLGCKGQNSETQEKTAEQILGNPDYLVFSYGAYREKTREVVPTIDELKEDMRILQAMGVKIVRTYNTQQFSQASDLLKAIQQLKSEQADFEMYVMLGAWIDCEGAWTGSVNHDKGSIENNSAEISAAVELANTYPEIVKIIAVGNEAMVHWASSYYVKPKIILNWVEHLQNLKKTQELPEHIWITSSDNFASWGGASEYQGEDLTALIKAVDYISLHTYPFHDTHYNPAFWHVPEDEAGLSHIEKAEAAMLRAKDHAISQYQLAAGYVLQVDPGKAIHIGETGWASNAGSLYGANGSGAADEYKAKLYYTHMRDWTNETGMSCFYFEAFDEQWKDTNDSLGSENHFGMINLNGEAKYALWKLLDAGAFKGLTRNGKTISKSFGGDESALLTAMQNNAMIKNSKE